MEKQRFANKNLNNVIQKHEKLLGSCANSRPRSRVDPMRLTIISKNGCSLRNDVVPPHPVNTPSMALEARVLDPENMNQKLPEAQRRPKSVGWAADPLSQNGSSQSLNKGITRKGPQLEVSEAFIRHFPDLNDAARVFGRDSRSASQRKSTIKNHPSSHIQPGNSKPLILRPQSSLRPKVLSDSTPSKNQNSLAHTDASNQGHEIKFAEFKKQDYGHSILPDDIRLHNDAKEWMKMDKDTLYRENEPEDPYKNAPTHGLIAPPKLLQKSLPGTRDPRDPYHSTLNFQENSISDENSEDYEEVDSIGAKSPSKSCTRKNTENTAFSSPTQRSELSENHFSPLFTSIDMISTFHSSTPTENIENHDPSASWQTIFNQSMTSLYDPTEFLNDDMYKIIDDDAWLNSAHTFPMLDFSFSNSIIPYDDQPYDLNTACSNGITWVGSPLNKHDKPVLINSESNIEKIPISGRAVCRAKSTPNFNTDSNTDLTSYLSRLGSKRPSLNEIRDKNWGITCRNGVFDTPDIAKSTRSWDSKPTVVDPLSERILVETLALGGVINEALRGKSGSANRLKPVSSIDTVSDSCSFLSSFGDSYYRCSSFAEPLFSRKCTPPIVEPRAEEQNAFGTRRFSPLFNQQTVLNSQYYNCTN